MDLQVKWSEVLPKSYNHNLRDFVFYKSIVLASSTCEENKRKITISKL
jgi:hypothetical protein